MPLGIVSAEERMETTGHKIQIWGEAKIGKTSLLWTLPEKETLILDFEGGLQSVRGWGGDSIPVRTWEDARNYTCMISGPNPALRDDQAYSKAHFDFITNDGNLGSRSQLDKYKNIFIDSTTFAASICMQWCKGQPESFSEKTGKPDTRGMYGLLGTELGDWARQLQYAPHFNIILVGGIKEVEDDVGRKQWVPMVDGGAAKKLPYIFDQIITMTELKGDDDKAYRAFVCQKMNPWGYPAGDRSGALDMLEKPHLGELIAKIEARGSATASDFAYQAPQSEAAA